MVWHHVLIPFTSLIARLPSLHGNSTRRALSDDEKRDPSLGDSFGGFPKKIETDSGIGKVVDNGNIGGVASAGTASGVSDLLDNVRREPEFNLKGIAKTPAGAVTSLDARDGVKGLFDSEDTDNNSKTLGGANVERQDDVSSVIDALRLLSRQLDELH